MWTNFLARHHCILNSCLVIRILNTFFNSCLFSRSLLQQVRELFQSLCTVCLVSLCCFQSINKLLKLLYLCFARVFLLLSLSVSLCLRLLFCRSCCRFFCYRFFCCNCLFNCNSFSCYLMSKSNSLTSLELYSWGFFNLWNNVSFVESYCKSFCHFSIILILKIVYLLLFIRFNTFISRINAIPMLSRISFHTYHIVVIIVLNCFKFFLESQNISFPFLFIQNKFCLSFIYCLKYINSKNCIE